MAAPDKDTLEIHGLSVDEYDDLQVILNQHAKDVDGSHRGVTEVLTGITAAVTFLWANREGIQQGLKLAEALISWVQNLRNRRKDEGRQAEPTRILLVSPEAVTLDLLRASPDEVRAYFRKHAGAQ